jgi:hypothetical protein
MWHVGHVGKEITAHKGKEIEPDCVDCCHTGQNRDKWQVHVDMAKNLQVP